jgi:uncharacterized protein (DUF952 family)
MAPHVVGSALPVVQIPGLTVEELVGNAATKQDALSVAHEKISAPLSEPWKTNDFDEWIVVLKGHIDILYADDKVLPLPAGQTCMIPKGDRYRPVFPVTDTEFLAICKPAFTPDRCHREEESTSTPVKSDNSTDKESIGDDGYPNVIYHMCETPRWQSALHAEEAYFPPTFEKDGGFTHASTAANSLLATANHFYQTSREDWICIELSRPALTKLGIVTRFEEAKPVGETATAEHAKSVIYPHIFGGIPAHVRGIVLRTLPMVRDSSGKFLSIEGL